MIKPKLENRRQPITKKRLPGYSRWFYWTLLGSCVISGVTGLLMIPGVLELKFDLDTTWRLDSTDRILVVALHVLLSWLLLILFGALWQSHIKGEWRKRRHWKSGLLLCVCLLLLSCSGVGLYYLGASETLRFASLGHSLLGVIFFVGIFSHVWLGRRYRRTSEHNVLTTKQFKSFVVYKPLHRRNN